MSEIDVQNSRQIRDPMDVLITMEVPATDITLTYSGYSSAKVADGILGESAWPMRLLADLKGDGFPLDGTRVVYDPNTTASATNGKIGVRSNIGQSVSVTVTGNRTISSLSIFATGAESVTYNGTTSAIVGGQVIIPVGARSITLTFNPASTTERIEVSEISAGTTLRITNGTLIKAVVSLRSDLSIIDPTLPESELNVDVYNDADISEIVASLPEDTPITYQAGYPGDMSPIRKFYVSGQVTWADNILSIHAVDAVHFLDQEMKTGAFISDLRNLARMAVDVFDDCGVTLVSKESEWGFTTLDSRIVIERGPYRNFISELMSVFKASEATTFSPWYVDAGIPSLGFTRNPPTYGVIEESDCADFRKNIDAALSEIIVQYYGVPIEDRRVYRQVGTFSLYKDTGAYIELDDYVTQYSAGFLNETYGDKGVYSTSGEYPILPVNEAGWSTTEGYLYNAAEWSYGRALFDKDVRQGDVKAARTGEIAYTQIVPWSAYYDPSSWALWRSMSQFWSDWTGRGLIGSDQTSVDGILWGTKLSKPPEVFTINKGVDGQSAYVSYETIWGTAFYYPPEATASKEYFPNEAAVTRFNASPITCSFTWKGDPRIQPRDVFTFHRLDGTDENWTFENITLTHEKGGTVAEITARKGIV